MDRIEDKYKEHAVKIESDGIYGSGCLFQTDKDYTYVFTAKHCIVKKGKVDFDKEKVKVTRFNNSASKLTILEIFLHDEFDLALIKIDKIEIETIQILKPKRHDKSAICGFPNKLKPEQNQFNILDGVVSLTYDNDFEIEANSPQFTFEDGTDENIIGLSGSGAFHEKENKLFLTGIFTRLKGENGAYNKYCVLNLDLFESLVKKNRIAPISTNKFYLKKKEGSLADEVFSVTYNSMDFDKLYYERKNDGIFYRYLDSPKNIWVNGTSGVGKTNLVFRNLIKRTEEFHYIYLGHVNSTKVVDFLHEINQEIILHFDINTPCNRNDILVQIANNLDKGRVNNFIFFVDEIIILNKEIFIDLIKSFITITESYSRKKNNKKIKFVIATREQPKEYFKLPDDPKIDIHKAYSNFAFSEIEEWKKEELFELLKIILKNFEYKANADIENKILENSFGLPRRLKNIIEKIYYEECSVTEAIEKVEKDHQIVSR